MNNPGIQLANLKASITRLVNETSAANECAIRTDSAHLKKLKQAIRHESNVIEPLVESCFEKFPRMDCADRAILLTFLDYFFSRSHMFRTYVLNRMHDLLTYVCEIDPQRNPLPRYRSKELKVLAIKIIKEWHVRFAPGYVKLANVASFLSASKALDYEGMNAELLAERRRNDEEDRRISMMEEKFIHSMREKWGKFKPDVVRCLNELDSALCILVPPIETDVQTVGNKQNKQLHGFGDSDIVTVTLTSVNPVVVVSSENDALVQTVIDGRTVMATQLKIIEKYLKRLTSLKTNAADFLKDLVDHKSRLEAMKQKAEELEIKGTVRKIRGDKADGEESDSDWEDVDDKKLEDFAMPNDTPDYIMDRLVKDDSEYLEPCGSHEFLNLQTDTFEKEEEEKQEEEIKSEKPKIPVLSYGLDLKYWGDDRKGVRIPKNDAGCHRFWRPPDDDGTMLQQDDVYQTRVFTYVGEERKSDKICRTPLPSGKLCPRRDFNRCPLHGVIVERDALGFPLKPVSEGEGCSYLMEAAQKEEEEYMKDLEQQTGKSIRMVKKKILKKMTFSPREGARQRLEKKLLDPKAVKRVSEALDAARKARLEKTFGHQFSHM
ncbi:unnamed protein product [Caenorhabditis auriculariae]|uniref:UV-stimulated scaffold protein A C-terminal domain-containing protein n=1 Tax=Caenorhabditis auriculariae TaxID=2777116 RepID=A0A8S1HMU5_9PELO|nr:unnamed protein product [Caenorhabditis auriculariae]